MPKLQVGLRLAKKLARFRMLMGVDVECATGAAAALYAFTHCTTNITPRIRSPAECVDLVTQMRTCELLASYLKLPVPALLL